MTMIAMTPAAMPSSSTVVTHEPKKHAVSSGHSTAQLLTSGELELNVASVVFMILVENALRTSLILFHEIGRVEMLNSFCLQVQT